MQFAQHLAPEEREQPTSREGPSDERKGESAPQRSASAPPRVSFDESERDDVFCGNGSGQDQDVTPLNPQNAYCYQRQFLNGFMDIRLEEDYE